MALSTTSQACAYFKHKVSHRRYSMTLTSNEVTRRGFFAKVGVAFNGVVGLALAVPILRYLSSPLLRERKGEYDSWLPLGSLDKFPVGETRIASYRNPLVNAWDGETADIACWVRNVDGQKFQ